ncbi:MAG: FAD-dependent oxidoreductase [Bacteroidota bacterium]
MKKPIIFSIDDDIQVLSSLKRDLRSNYKKEFRVVSTADVNEALEALDSFKKKGEDIALFISDQRMPILNGVEFLEKAKEIYPEAKRVLLTAYSETDAAIKAINDVQLDYYLLKPWDPPEEKLYPVLDELLEEWESTHIPNFQGIRMVGNQYDPLTHTLKDFLAGNLRPYQWLDIELNPKGRELLQIHELAEDKLPVIAFENGEFLIQPSIQDLATKIGLHPTAQTEMYDVVIIGAGPAGLSAAVYGATEGLKTLLIERRAPGGQAGTSSRIENYLGFPNGLSGAELTRRALTQAQRFGTEFLSPQEVVDIRLEHPYKILTLGDGSTISTKSIIITTGVAYRKLDTPGIADYSGAGIYYGAAMTEAKSCSNKQVYIVGGGNSAGQGAVYLSKFAEKVTILVRKPDLSATMSSYLIDQINEIPNISVEGRRQIVEAKGENGHLSCLQIEDMDSGERELFKADALFIFIGTKPYTQWISVEMLRNEKGYLETGRNLNKYTSFQKIWKQAREPYVLETCQPGIFAAGDVRAGAMNRVASAVGEGAMAIKFVHQYLDTI